MHDTLLMHVAEGACNLMDVLPDSLLREAHVLLDGLLDDELEVPFLGPLDRDEELVELVVDEPVEVLDDVRVV